MILGRWIHSAVVLMCLSVISPNVPAAQPLPARPPGLLEAARRGNADAVGRFLAAKTDVNIRDARGRKIGRAHV